MPLQLDALAQEIRTRLGDLSQAALPGAALDAALAAAVREYSRFRPLHQNVTVQLAQNVDTYALPSGCIELDDVWVRPLAGAGLDPFFSGSGVPYVPAQLATNRAPTDFYEDVVRMGYTPIDDAFALVEVDPAQDPPLLRVSPVPQFAAEVRAVGAFVRPVASIPAADAELLLLYVRGDCLEYVGTKRSKSVERIPTATGSLKLSDGSDLRAEGARLKAEFYCKMGGGLTAVARG